MSKSEGSAGSSLERVASSIEEDDFNGAIIGFRENILGPSVFADGFGPDGEEMLARIGEFLSSTSSRDRAMPPGERKSRRKRKSLDAKGQEKRVLEKLEEIQSQENQYAVVWMEEEDSEVRVGFEGLSDNPSKLIYSLDAGLRMQANWGRDRSPVDEKDPQYRDGKILDFEDVVGMEEVKETFEEMVIRPLKYPDLHEKYQLTGGGGVMLYGPPGCGKTHIARAAAGELDAELYHVKLSDIMNKWFGESEQRIKRLFENAKENAPSILFFDEIDALAENRGNMQEPMRKLLAQLLSELDGFEKFEDVMILGATNRPWAVDPAVTRPGRIEKTLFVSPPGHESREELFRYYTRDRPVKDLDYGSLADLSADFSCADVKHACDQALKMALKSATSSKEEGGLESGLEKAGMEEFERAIDNMEPSIGRWVRSTENRIEKEDLRDSYPELKRFIEDYDSTRERGGENLYV